MQPRDQLPEDIDRLLDTLPHYAPRAGFADRVLTQVEIHEPWYASWLNAARRFIPTSRTLRALALAGGGIAATVVTTGTIGLLRDTELTSNTASVMTGDALGLMRSTARRGVAALVGAPAAATSTLNGQEPSAAILSLQDSAQRTLDSAQAATPNRQLPTADRFSWGDLTIAAGTTVDGSVAVANGSVDVYGRVRGDVFTLGGDIRVHPGGDVTGSALALHGKVVVDGGHVGGEMRAMLPPYTVSPEHHGRIRRAQNTSVRHALNVTFAWFAIIVSMGLLVNIFSGPKLEGVSQALQRRFVASFFLGLLAQAGAIPLLVLICVALALTVVGVLLIPFAVVAYILGTVGLVTMGMLAAATVAGHRVIPEGPNVRLRAIQSLVLGTVLLMMPWVVNALMINRTWSAFPLHLLALGVTWVAITAGLGAALLARGGVRRVRVNMGGSPPRQDGWQTPTPIGGIVTPRRSPSTPSEPPHDAP